MLPGDELLTIRLVLEALKECYEAVVLYDFLALMYVFAGVKAGSPIPEGMRGKLNGKKLITSLPRPFKLRLRYCFDSAIRTGFLLMT